MNGTSNRSYYAKQWAESALDETACYPRLVVPRQLRDLNPLWQNCGLAIDGLFDPPVPLIQASTICEVSGVADTTAVEASVIGGQTAESAGQPTGSFAGKTTAAIISVATATVSKHVSGGPIAATSQASPMLAAASDNLVGAENPIDTLQSQAVANNRSVGGQDPVNKSQGPGRVIVTVIVQMASAAAQSGSVTKALTAAQTAFELRQSGVCG